MKRFLLIDLNHIIHRYYYAVSQGYYGIDRGVERVKENIEQLKKFSNADDVLIAADSFNGTLSRKKFYESKLGGDSYKDNRKDKEEEWVNFRNAVVENIPKTYPKFYTKEDFEADDIVKALIDKANNKVKIIVVCNDTDLLPLVNDYVDVLLFRTKSKFKGGLDRYHLLDGGYGYVPEDFHYVVVDTASFSEVTEEINSYKGYNLTPESLLFQKVLRGDKSDNIPMIPGQTPTKVKSYLEDFYNKDYSLRYGMSTDKVKEIFEDYLDGENLEKAIINYQIMDLNSDFEGLRKPFEI